MAVLLLDSDVLIVEAGQDDLSEEAGVKGFGRVDVDVVPKPIPGGWSWWVKRGFHVPLVGSYCGEDARAESVGSRG